MPASRAGRSVCKVDRGVDPARGVRAVGVREVNVRYFEVEAESETEAKELVQQRAPNVVDNESIEYSHELDSGTCSVEPVP